MEVLKKTNLQKPSNMQINTEESVVEQVYRFWELLSGHNLVGSTRVSTWEDCRGIDYRE